VGSRLVSPAALPGKHPPRWPDGLSKPAATRPSSGYLLDQGSLAPAANSSGFLTMPDLPTRADPVSNGWAAG